MAPETPAVHRTRITQLRQVPVDHYFEHRSYSWYVDVDDLPRLPSWVRMFARFDPRDHFTGVDGDTLRQRIDRFLARHAATLRGRRRCATIVEVLRLQVVAPAAPLATTLEMWLQGVTLWLRRVPRTPWRPMAEPAETTSIPSARIDVTDLPDTSVAS